MVQELMKQGILKVKEDKLKWNLGHFGTACSMLSLQRFWDIKLWKKVTINTLTIYLTA